MEAVMTPTSRVKRLLAMILALNDPHSVTQLAVEFGVCQRTIQRDLALLQSDPLYIPLYEPQDCFYQVLPGWTWERHV